MTLNVNSYGATLGWVALILLLPCCATMPRFGVNDSIVATTGTESSVTINVNHWQPDTQLTLLPGGPFRSNALTTAIPVTLLAKQAHYIVSINQSNQLCITDFTVTPARQLSCIDLSDQVSALLVNDNHAYIGFEHDGVWLYDISNPAAVLTQAQLLKAPQVTRLRLYNNKLYALSDHHAIAVRSLNDVDSKPAQSHVESAINLPEAVNDFDLYDGQLVLIGTKFGVALTDTTSTPALINPMWLQDTPLQLNVVDKTAYVAEASGGMLIINLSHANQLSWLGSYGKLPNITKTLVGEHNAYIVDRQLRIASVNLHEKHLPITGSFYMPAEKIIDAIMENDTVYLSTPHEIQQIRFPDLAHTQISNEGVNQGGSRRAFIENNIAYVADWFSGLHLYDISEPRHPRHLSNFHTQGSSKGVVVAEGIAYVGDDDHGLQIIDVHDPLHPVKISELATDGLAYTLKKVGNRIYLADHRGGFYIVDVSDVSKPVILGHYDTPGKSWAIDVVKTTAYIADDTTGLLIFDVSDAAHPKQIGQFNPGGYAEDVEVRNGKAYVSFFDKGFYMLDVSQPKQPRLISHLDIPGNARSVMLDGDLAYVAGWESGMNIVDVSIPDNLKIIGRYDSSGSAWGVNVYAQRAYIWDWWGGIKVTNVTNPTQPHLIGQYQARDTVNKLRHHGHFLYAANGNSGVQVFDIQNVLNPIWTTGIDLDGETHDVWIADDANHLYAACDSAGLAVLDIHEPFYIRKLAMHNTGGKAVIVRQLQKYVVVANKPRGLVVYDASDPIHLSQVQNIDVEVNDMWVNKNSLFIASNDQGLLIYQTNNHELNDQGLFATQTIKINDSANRITATDHILVSAVNQQGVTLWRIDHDRYKPVADIALTDTITGLQIHDNKLLVYGRRQGLLSYDITAISHPLLQLHYPATDVNTDFTTYEDAVLFAGNKSVSSVQLLPALSYQRVSETQLQINVPATLPVGNYHIGLNDSNGTEQLWPNALQVKRKEPSKPKLSPEHFKQLLEQYRSQHPIR